MPAYAAAIPRPPRVLTELERATLLKVTGEHRDGFRDHVVCAVARGTGLRELENENGDKRAKAWDGPFA